MKRCIAIIALFLPLLAHGKTDRTSQTFMFPRPLYHNLGARTGMWDTVIAEKKGNACIAAQVIPIYQESRHYKALCSNNTCTTKTSEDCSGKGYFLLNCKSTVKITSGDTQTDVLARDIRAEWLEITTPNFEGTLTICPEQKQYGALIAFNQGLQAWTDWNFLKTWWVEASVPIVKVKNRLNTFNSSTEVVNSLKRNNLDFARLVNGEQESTGLAEIRLTFGNTYLNEHGFFLSYYSGLGLPTERNPKPKTLFTPTRGNNGHLNIIAGFQSKFPLMEYQDTCNLRLFFDIENRYYVPNHQCRTFDLKNPNVPNGARQWSRYLLVRREGEAKTIPAANILTFEVKVSPHSFVDITTGLEFSGECWRFEVGYDFWAHSSEHIEMRDIRCDKKLRAFEQYGIAGTGTNSASKSTIDKLAADDTDDNNNNIFITIKDTDIDLKSGSGRGGSSNRWHAALYYHDTCNTDRMTFGNCAIFLGAGIFYEDPRTNVTLKTWGLWAKAGTEF